MEAEADYEVRSDLIEALIRASRHFDTLHLDECYAIALLLKVLNTTRYTDIETMKHISSRIKPILDKEK